jgi:hypothetical protein
MGYQKTGFVVKPRSTYILDAALAISNAYGTDLDKGINETIRSLGKENIRLTNFFFEFLLILDHPKLAQKTPDGGDLKTAFLVLLADFMQQTGYINTAPVFVDYVTDPVMTFDECIRRMLGARMPTFKADDIGGQFATIDSLARFFPEVIRRYVQVLNEAQPLAERLRKWLGNIGHILMTTGTLSQAQMTAFVMYASTKEGSAGHSDLVPEETAIPAVEINDLMVSEAGTLYSASSLPGPYHNHSKIISDALLQRLTFYFGLHSTDLKTSSGFYRTFGPFMMLDLTPHDSVPWSTDDHLAGITARTSYMMAGAGQAASYAIRVPHVLANRNEWGIAGAYPDDPSYRLTLTEQSDISQYEWDYYSEWRGVRINSVINSGTMELALADKALSGSAIGACQIEHPTLDNMGLAVFTKRAMEKIRVNPTRRITEEYFLPSNGGAALTKVNMTGFYSRIGTVEVIPAFSEFLEVPLKWFMQPAPRVVEYVASMTGMPLDQKYKFDPIIALYHNLARFERLTGHKPSFDIDALAKALLNL